MDKLLGNDEADTKGIKMNKLANINCKASLVHSSGVTDKSKDIAKGMKVFQIYSISKPEKAPEL